METPNHYDFEIQPVDYITKNGLGFCEGNVVKYVSRWKLKNGREDLLKARHYLDILLSIYDDNNPSWRSLSVFVIITTVKPLPYVPFYWDSLSPEELLNHQPVTAYQGR